MISPVKHKYKKSSNGKMSVTKYNQSKGVYNPGKEIIQWAYAQETNIIYLK